MVNNILWATGSQGYLVTPVSLLTTELNALANGSYSAASAAIDNTSNKAVYADLEFVGSSVTPTAGAYIAVWFLRSIDGTNYEDGGGAVAPTRPPDAVISVTVGSSITPRNVRPMVVLPPGKFKVVALNKLGPAMGATGNTLKMGPYAEAVN